MTITSRIKKAITLGYTASAALLMLGALGCDGSKPSRGSHTTPVDKTVHEAAAPAIKQEAWRCTSEDITRLKRALEASCNIRPEYSDDCLALYQPLPVWSFDSSRSHTREYCSLERPDSKTIILSSRGPALGKPCVSYTAKFASTEQEWKLASMDVDKTCSD